MTLRIELFVHDLAASVDFYRRVLGFSIHSQSAEDYVPMVRGDVKLALTQHSRLSKDHPAKAAAGHAMGRGIEIVLEVDDPLGEYRRVTDQGWPVSGPPQLRPWGLTDFRVTDPDGYYLRITSRQ
jgi:catechol 2,3-dioxygenase-like lactoylglutathione lyase family enzyme